MEGTWGRGKGREGRGYRRRLEPDTDKRHVVDPPLMVQKHKIFVHFLYPGLPPPPPTTPTPSPSSLPLSDVYSVTPGQS